MSYWQVIDKANSLDPAKHLYEQKDFCPWSITFSPPISCYSPICLLNAALGGQEITRNSTLETFAARMGGEKVMLCG